MWPQLACSKMLLQRPAELMEISVTTSSLAWLRHLHWDSTASLPDLQLKLKAVLSKKKKQCCIRTHIEGKTKQDSPGQGSFSLKGCLPRMTSLPDCPQHRKVAPGDHSCDRFERRLSQKGCADKILTHPMICSRDTSCSETHTAPLVSLAPRGA